MITNVTLTTKEKLLLEDSKSHEEQCVKKYSNYTNLAADNELKAVFRSNGQKEQEHLETINQLLNGKIPAMNNQTKSQTQQQQDQQQQQQTQQMPQQQQQQQQSSFQNISGSTSFNASDKDLCMDMLTTEKYISGAYDTAIFEFRDAQIRDILNHIQKEEQKHGEAIFMYMESKGMYQAQ
jgi:spore coat protein CotF